MGQFSIEDNLYLYPTPGGAYYAVSAEHSDPPRQLLRALLYEGTTPSLSIENLKQLSGLDDEDQVLGLLQRAQNLHWVQGLDGPLDCLKQPLEQILPDLLKTIAAKGKALLADSEGFYVASSGFPHEVAEELSGLSAELANLHERRAGLLTNNMGISSSAWAVVGASGYSEVGFWPLYIGSVRFVLVISGLPRFNQPDFLTIIWALSTRYGEYDT